MSEEIRPLRGDAELDALLRGAAGGDGDDGDE